MDVPIDDSIVFPEVSDLPMRAAPINIPSRLFQRIAEKEISAIVVAQRFERACVRFVQEARKIDTSKDDYPLPRGLPYRGFGNLHGQERLAREIEADFGALLANASTLEDLACNAAVELSSYGAAWVGCERDPNGGMPARTMGRRAQARRALRAGYGAAGNDLAPLEWISRYRNEAAHEHYFFTAVVKDAGEVLFTHESDDFAAMNHTAPKTPTANRLIEAVGVLHHFLGWFYQETTVQASPTLTSWRNDAGEDD